MVIRVMQHLSSFLFIAAIAVGCSSSHTPTLAPNVTAAQQRSASLSMRISFPQETEFLLYHRASDKPSLLPLPDDVVHLKVALPSVVAEKLLTEPPFASAKWETTVRHVRDSPNWKAWRPSRVKKFRSAEIQLPTLHWLRVSVDEDRKEQTIVYLEYREI